MKKAFKEILQFKGYSEQNTKLTDSGVQGFSNVFSNVVFMELERGLEQGCVYS